MEYMTLPLRPLSASVARRLRTMEPTDWASETAVE